MAKVKVQDPQPLSRDGRGGQFPLPGERARVRGLATGLYQINEFK